MFKEKNSENHQIRGLWLVGNFRFPRHVTKEKSFFPPAKVKANLPFHHHRFPYPLRIMEDVILPGSPCNDETFLDPSVSSTYPGEEPSLDPSVSSTYPGEEPTTDYSLSPAHAKALAHLAPSVSSTYPGEEPTTMMALVLPAKELRITKDAIPSVSILDFLTNAFDLKIHKQANGKWTKLKEKLVKMNIIVNSRKHRFNGDKYNTVVLDSDNLHNVLSVLNWEDPTLCTYFASMEFDNLLRNLKVDNIPDYKNSLYIPKDTTTNKKQSKEEIVDDAHICEEIVDDTIYNVHVEKASLDRRALYVKYVKEVLGIKKQKQKQKVVDDAKKLLYNTPYELYAIWWKKNNKKNRNRYHKKVTARDCWDELPQYITEWNSKDCKQYWEDELTLNLEFKSKKHSKCYQDIMQRRSMDGPPKNTDGTLRGQRAFLGIFNDTIDPQTVPISEWDSLLIGLWMDRSGDHEWREQNMERVLLLGELIKHDYDVELSSVKEHRIHIGLYGQYRHRYLVTFKNIEGEESKPLWFKGVRLCQVPQYSLKLKEFDLTSTPIIEEEEEEKEEEYAVRHQRKERQLNMQYMAEEIPQEDWKINAKGRLHIKERPDDWEPKEIRSCLKGLKGLSI